MKFLVPCLSNFIGYEVSGTLYGLARIWKESVVVSCKFVCHHLLAGTEETFDTDTVNTATSEI